MDNFNIQKFFKDQYLTEDYTSEYDEETAKRNMFAAKYNTPEDTKRFRNYMEFLSKLRTSGKTNMFGAAPYLQAEFNLDKKEAKDLLAYWMGSYRNPDLDESLNENFEMGDKVKLTPDYEETPGEVFTITQTSGNRYFIADEDGRGWYTYADQLVRADDEYVNEAMVDYDFSNEELIRVIKQLKRGASTEIGMIKAFEKALGRELTDDEIRGFKLEEAKKKAKKNTKKLNKPMRDSSGGKAYKVYVKDPKTKKIKTVRFGSGGLRAKINNPKARKAFAARHKCSQKKDRTKASYWSCRLPRYAKKLGLSGGGTWW